MTETKKILNIALPAMAENLLQMLMGVVDSYLVAQVGIVAISGVSVANNIITIYQAIFIALGASSASVIARSLGKGDVKATNRDTWDAIIITLALSLILGLLSIFGGGAILNLLGLSLIHIWNRSVLSVGLHQQLTQLQQRFSKPSLH